MARREEAAYIFSLMPPEPPHFWERLPVEERRQRGKYFLVSVLGGLHEILAWEMAMTCDEEVAALDEAVPFSKLRGMIDQDAAKLWLPGNGRG